MGDAADLRQRDRDPRGGRARTFMTADWARSPFDVLASGAWQPDHNEVLG